MLPREGKLSPRFVAGDGNGVRQIQVAAAGPHRDSEPVLGWMAREHRVRESARLRSEQQRIAFPEFDVAVRHPASGRERERARRGVRGVECVERRVLANRCPFVIAEAGAPKPGLVELKPQRFDEVQHATGIGAEPYDVAGVGGNLRLIEDDVEHDPGPA